MMPIWRKVVIPLFVLLLVPVLCMASDEEADKGELVPAAQDGSSAPTPCLFELMHAPTGTASLKSGQTVQLSRDAMPEPFEYFVDVFYGPVSSVQEQVAASYGNTAANKNVSFTSSKTAGFRWGVWGRGMYRFFGFGLDLSSLSQKGHDVSVDYTPLAFQGMLRAGIFPSEQVPLGRLQIHGGIGFALVLLGDIEVAYAELPNAMSSGLDSGSGSVKFVGASWLFDRLSVYAELRWMDISLDFSTDDALLHFGPREAASLSMDTRQTVFGLRYRY